MNPIAMILSTQMMLEWLEEREAAATLEKTVVDVMMRGEVLTLDIGGSSSTEEMAAAISKRIARKEF